MAVIDWIIGNAEWFIIGYAFNRLAKLEKQSIIHSRQITVIGHHVDKMEK